MKSIAGTGFLKLRLSARTLEILELFQEADGQPHLFRLSPVVEQWIEDQLARQPQLAAEFAEREARAARVTARVAAPPPASAAVPAAPRGTAPVTARVTAPVTGRVHPK